MNTCDKRSTKSILSTEYPTFDFHEPFEEEDTLWVADYREREPEMVIRLDIELRKIFDEEWNKSSCRCQSVLVIDCVRIDNCHIKTYLSQLTQEQ